MGVVVRSVVKYICSMAVGSIVKGTLGRTCVVSFLLIGISTAVFGEVWSPEKMSPKSHRANDDTDDFKPSKEWQTVKKGQAIPRGLHVRMNLEKGTTEAKLLDEKTPSSKHTAVIVSEDSKERDTLLSEEVQKSIVNISDDVNTTTDEDIARVMKQFRTYKDLKKDIKDLQLELKTDMELMDNLLSKFKVSSDDDEKVTILSDLEYLVHQFDNAREFSKAGGLLDVIFPSLNSSSAAVRSEAALVVGSAVQSNPKVQISMLEGGGIGTLLRLIALDSDPVVRSRGVYALSCLVRKFPMAQAKLVADGGLSALATLFASERQDDLKLQVKVVTLLRDLVMERVEAEKTVAEGGTAVSDQDVEKMRQYRAAGLEEQLVHTGWCERLPRLLHAQSSSKSRTGKRDDLSSAIAEQLSIRPEHDVVEKVVGAMLALSKLCVDKFRDSATHATLLDLKIWYDDLALLEQSEGRTSHDAEDQLYFTKLSQLLSDIISKLKISNSKDEL